MSGWQPIATAPLDGTVIDLWMVDKTGPAYREADAYYVTDHPDDVMTFATDGTMQSVRVKRDGWFGPNHDYDGQDGWADEPVRFNAHPAQNRWIGCQPTHWMPRPEGPTE